MTTFLTVDPSSEPAGNPGHAYLAYDQATDAFKIGYSARWKHRDLELRPARIVALAPGGFGLEAKLHREHADLRIKGEWFKPCPEWRELVAQAEDARHRHWRLVADTADEMIERGDMR